MEHVHDSNPSLLRSVDKFTLLLFILLTAAGWICVVGASYNYGDTEIVNFAERSGKQLIWIVCAFALGLTLLLTDDRFYDTFANILYIGFLVILAITPLIATPHKGSYSWITIGPISIQPAEFAKCATALALAKCMGTYGFSLNNLRDRIRAVIIVSLPIILIILQRETGSALVYLAFFLVFYREGMSGSILFIGFAAIVYFVVGLRYDPYPLPYTATTIGRFTVLSLISIFTCALLWFHIKNKGATLRIAATITLVTTATYLVSRYYYQFDISIAVAILNIAIILYLLFLALRNRLVSYAYISLFAIGSMGMYYSTDYVMNHVMKPHQQIRIRVLLGLEEDINGAGYNVHQSQIAIGSGGLYGKGFLNGTQTKLKYVPEQDTDFIFCTVGEEHGFVGCSIVLILFTALILRLIHLAERQTRAFGRIFGYCVLSIFLFHLFINIGMVMGLTPVIGIPLPFFSYGGSSLWGFTLLLFIFLRIDATREKYRR